MKKTNKITMRKTPRGIIFSYALTFSLIVAIIALSALGAATGLLVPLSFFCLVFGLGTIFASAGPGVYLPHDIEIPNDKSIKRKVQWSYGLGSAALVCTPLALIPLFLLSVFPPAGAVFAGLLLATGILIGVSVLLAMASHAIQPVEVEKCPTTELNTHIAMMVDYALAEVLHRSIMQAYQHLEPEKLKNKQKEIEQKLDSRFAAKVINMAQNATLDFYGKPVVDREEIRVVDHERLKDVFNEILKGEDAKVSDDAWRFFCREKHPFHRHKTIVPKAFHPP